MSTLSMLGHRDPGPLLQQALQTCSHLGDVWVFGYASLIWKPEFESIEDRPATVHGFHRALAMRSRINRGTPERPGLVFALVAGGSCRGRAYRIERGQVDREMKRLWDREMLTGVYDPKWLLCKTPLGPIRALAFTLARSSPAHTGALPDDEVVEILKSAEGRYGSTLHYLMETAASLRACGIRDRDVERLVALAERHVPAARCA